MRADLSATAVAYPNIALIKYWGKRDTDLVLPWTSSLSMTLDAFETTTTVAQRPEADEDRVMLNGTPAAGEIRHRVVRFLQLVRDQAHRTELSVVDSRNTVPTAAGLASSASGFAALAVAAAAAYGLDLDATALSRLARRGSGSAARSIFGGFAIWHTGHDDRTSYAEPVPAPDFGASMVIAIVDSGPKAVSSRDAMGHTVATSPLYWPWVEASRTDLTDMRTAVARGDIDAMGEIAERNMLGMHGAMLAARPAVRYFLPATVAVLDSVLHLRRAGVSAYATMDAGPNVKILCRRADADRIADEVRAAATGCSIVVAGIGPAARLETRS